jgi:hypothetical protein
LENYIIQELSNRGANIIYEKYDQSLRIDEIDITNLFDDRIHFILIGCISKIIGGKRMKEVYTELESEYEMRHKEYVRDRNKWYYGSESYQNKTPEPILKPRTTKEVEVKIIIMQFVYKIISNDNVILAASNCEEVMDEDDILKDSIYIKIARKAISYLDNVDVWSKVRISM